MTADKGSEIQKQVLRRGSVWGHQVQGQGAPSAVAREELWAPRHHSVVHQPICATEKGREPTWGLRQSICVI